MVFWWVDFFYIHLYRYFVSISKSFAKINWKSKLLKKTKTTKSIMVDVWEKSGDPKDCKAFHADPHTHEPSDKNNGSNDKLNEVLEWH